MTVKRRPPGLYAMYRIAYLKGWDSALIDPLRYRACPYQRPDFIERWHRGRGDCLANKPLPSWYAK